MTIHEVRMTSEQTETAMGTAQVDVTINGERRTVDAKVFFGRVSFYGVGAYAGRTGTKVWNQKATIVVQNDPEEARKLRVTVGKWYLTSLDNGIDYHSARLWSTGSISRVVDWFDKVPEARRSKR